MIVELDRADENRVLNAAFELILSAGAGWIDADSLSETAARAAGVMSMAGYFEARANGAIFDKASGDLLFTFLASSSGNFIDKQALPFYLRDQLPDGYVTESGFMHPDIGCTRDKPSEFRMTADGEAIRDRMNRSIEAIQDFRERINAGTNGLFEPVIVIDQLKKIQRPAVNQSVAAAQAINEQTTIIQVPQQLPPVVNIYHPEPSEAKRKRKPPKNAPSKECKEKLFDVRDLCKSNIDARVIFHREWSHLIPAAHRENPDYPSDGMAAIWKTDLEK